MAFGETEILAVALLGLFLFGAKKTVDWAKALGQAKRAFKEEAEKSIDKKNK